MAVVRLSVDEVVGAGPDHSLMHALQKKGFPVVVELFGQRLTPDWGVIISCKTEYDPKTMEYIYIWEERVPYDKGGQ